MGVVMFEKSNQFDRRSFLKTGGACLGFCLFSPSLDITKIAAPLQLPEPKTEAIPALHEAQYYKKLDGLEIECRLCPRKCTVGDRERGFCGVRENRGGTYYTLVYGNPCTINIDPIEKKPLFHFLPGVSAFSIATAGCNLNCKFCQNWQISQFRPEQIKSMEISPEGIASDAENSACPVLAYTYSEPTIFFEYLKDCAISGQARNLRSVMITAGFIEPEPMMELLPHLAAVKVDLKSFNEKYYQDICNAELKPVLDTLILLKKSEIWFEIVYLMLPTLNDSKEEIELLCKWLLKELGPDIPIHFARFHPEYLLKNLPSTPIESLEQAYKIARDTGLNFPYIGNVPGHMAESTYCPNCKTMVIERKGFQVKTLNLEQGLCKKCGRKIPGIWA
jgi:pyruvate formate lyase activating enzyme